ncbi:MAG: hypothetical protein ABUL67_03875 [Haliangium ochraceum]
MTSLATRWLVLVGLIGLGGACVPSSNTPAATGGKVGTGSGGASTGSGGASTGSGGASTGSGGASTGSGGGGVTDGGVTPSVAYTFNTGVEGFVLDNYVNLTATNLAAPDSGSAPALAFDSAAGDPSPGSLRASGTFTAYKQYVDVIININSATPLNLTGKTLRAKVKLASGVFPGGATLHASTGATYAYASGTYTTLGDGTWKELTLDLSTGTSAGWDASKVVQIGIQFYSGNPPDAGPFPGPIDAVFQIDSITDGDVPTNTTDAGVPAHAYTFDTSTQTFAFNNYAPTDGRTNLGRPDSGPTPTLTFDSAEGNPSPGALKAAVTFSAFREFVDIVINPSPAINLAGKTIHAKVRLTSGTFDTGAGATLHVGTTADYLYGAGAYTALTVGTWTDLTLDLTNVTTTGWDPSMVVQIGVQFYTGDVPEAGTFMGPNDVVFHIDSITD